MRESRCFELPSELPRASGASFVPRPPTATLPGLAWMNLPEFPAVSSGFHPAQARGGYPAAPSMFRSGSPLSPFH